MTNELGARMRIPVRKTELSNSPEDLQKARVAVCGSDRIENAKDAELILEALGLIPTKYNVEEIL